MSKKYKNTIRTQGFTLVELSIVIIIIGFLIAGISAGTSLIKQASLSSVITDFQGFQTSYNNFVLRFNSIPGDSLNGANYFPSCAATAGDCNGNGNGLIEFKAGVPDESYSAWRGLSLANMISAGITQIPHTWAGVEILGATVPVSKITGAGYILAGSGVKFGTGGGAVANAVSPWTDGTTNSVFIGKVSTTGLGGAVFIPQDAFNIDKKIDDGSIDSAGNFNGANTGSVRSIDGADQAVAACETAATGVYAIATTTPACVTGFAIN